MTVKATRLRYASSSSPDELEAFVNALPFKIEIKTITLSGKKWFCWFVLPDNISQTELEEETKDSIVELSSIELEEF